jgi:hypothetical protein
MKLTNSNLLKNPDEFFQTENDHEAKAFLVEVGLSAQIKTDITESRTQLITYGDHSTHFIAVEYFTGKTVKTDNGYLIYCLPKSQFSADDFAEFLQKAFSNMHFGIEVLRPLKTAPKLN